MGAARGKLECDEYADIDILDASEKRSGYVQNTTEIDEEDAVYWGEIQTRKIFITQRKKKFDEDMLDDMKGIIFIISENCTQNSPFLAEYLICVHKRD